MLIVNTLLRNKMKFDLTNSNFPKKIPDGPTTSSITPMFTLPCCLLDKQGDVNKGVT